MGPNSGEPITFTPTDVDRFWSQVDKTADCWVWKGTATRDGYGQQMINAMGRPVTAHRMSYSIHVGPIPKGMCVMHACDNPPCVNPAHLKLGTHLDNMRDMVAKGRKTKPEPRLTHCKRGHLLPPAGERRQGAWCDHCDRSATEKEQTVRNRRWRRAARRWLKPYLSSNTELVERLGLRRAAILKSVYGLYGAELLTMEDISHVFGVSRERVRQLREQALDMLGVPTDGRMGGSAWKVQQAA